MVASALYCIAALVGLATIAIALGASDRGRVVVYGASLIVAALRGQPGCEATVVLRRGSIKKT